MNEEQLKYFETKLLTLQKELQHDMIALKEKAKPVSPDVSLGRLTRQEAMLEQNIAKENLIQNELRLKKIDSALHRVYHKTYGECLDCGEDIALGRLEILPEGALCIACASIQR